ncbi:TPA: hypothetical protein JS389_003623, partial [Serratia marcescens]|nr:hypothetical protein [Serratia marcescens]
MAQRYNTGNPRPSNSMKDLNDNALAYDDFLNGEQDEAYDRFQKPFPTVRRQVADRIDEITGAQKSIEQYTDEAKQAADNAQNIADANTYYTSPTDPDGTIAGIAGTPDGKMFRVAQGVGADTSFIYYRNDNGTPVPIAEQSGKVAIDKVAENIRQLYLVNNNLWDGKAIYLAYNNADNKLTVARGSENYKSAVIPIEPGVGYTVASNGDRFRIGTHAEYPKVGDVATEMTWPRGANGADYDVTTGQPFDIIEFTTPANARYLMIGYTSTNQDVKLFVVKSESAKNINLVQFGAGFKAESVDAIGRVTGENIRNGKNLADISKKYPRYIPGNLSVGDVIDLSTESDPAHMRSLYVRVQPNTAYTVAKDATDGFRIGFTNRHPDLGAQIRIVHVDGMVNTATITSGDNEYFMVVTFNQNYLRQPGAIMVQEGTEFTGFESYGTLMQTAAPISRSGEKMPWQPIDSRIRRGKNLFDGNYQIAWLSGSPTDNSGAYQIDGPNGRTAVIRVPRNTVVTISKTDSDRMRIAGIKWLPLHQSAVEFLTDTHMDGHNIVTVNTRDNDYLLIYVSITGAPPSFMQVELGPTKTAWQTYGDELVNPAVNIEDGHGADDGTVGNANYLLKPAGATEYGAYADAAGTIPATDDTEALKLKILAATQTGKLEFEAGKNYLVSDTLMIDPALIR